jgi:hypothetical protein
VEEKFILESPSVCGESAGEEGEDCIQPSPLHHPTKQESIRAAMAAEEERVMKLSLQRLYPPAEHTQGDLVGEVGEETWAADTEIGEVVEKEDEELVGEGGDRKAKKPESVEGMKVVVGGEERRESGERWKSYVFLLLLNFIFSLSLSLYPSLLLHFFPSPPSNSFSLVTSHPPPFLFPSLNTLSFFLFFFFFYILSYIPN